ncbi:hypothetical protein LOZ58_001371 [Ophidiomyces ophidiicola]|nr:hypothetical protein LOZ58_001371 [Ophidiomyces ophidiicola]
MSSGSTLSRRRTHNLLLISTLLNLRDTASPLTLLLDSLEQPAYPVLAEYIRRAKLSKSHVVFISFDTFKRPKAVDTFIFTTKKGLNEVLKEVRTSISNVDILPEKRCLLIIDSVHALASRGSQGQPVNVAEYLSNLLASASSRLQVSLVMVHHQDLPSPRNFHPYAPSLLSLVTYLATTIIAVHSLTQVLARKVAADKSMVSPVFGVNEETEGIIIGQQDSKKKLNKYDGIVLEMEHRRKSGRGIVEWYFLPRASQYTTRQPREIVILLDDHPQYRREEETVTSAGEELVSTFELGLTERQRRDRENVVLPYFDAQKGEGPGEGGRILYEMGEEDDFDEEEDEI